jgi:hypothetical protein
VYARPSEIFREVDDPSLGTIWVLLRDPAAPGGPGRWVSATESNEIPRGGTKERVRTAARIPMIRAGEPLLVEEHSAVVDARLEATALCSAAKGDELQARLKIGGKVVRAVVAAPGRAVLEPDSPKDEDQR